ncbi:hypothetical protein [Bdellovibrio sp. HCB209]|uniref:hypothetical protein n=1 Tax=Bdellovibrio sp. HCB209 TaxID=3394354 RepID=UPI0039B427A4
MNWKKLLKYSAVAFSSIIIVFGILGVWLLTQLPGPSKVKEVLNKSSAKLQNSSTTSTTNSPQNASPLGDTSSDTAVSPSSPNETMAPQKRVATQQEMSVILNDLANNEKPFVDACKDLGLAGESGFFPKKTERTATKFFEGISGSQKDPVLESVAPVLRFVFRAPGITEVLKLSEDSRGDDSLLEKAELYRQIYRAADYLQKNQTQLNQVVQKSYNLHMIAKAVALKPQLAHDGATKSFCEQIENSLSAKQNLNVEEQVQEMQKFLQDAGIDAKTIGFDPNYRAQVHSEFGKNNLTIKDAWLKDLIDKGMM